MEIYSETNKEQFYHLEYAAQEMDKAVAAPVADKAIRHLSSAWRSVRLQSKSKSEPLFDAGIVSQIERKIEILEKKIPPEAQLKYNQLVTKIETTVDQALRDERLSDLSKLLGFFEGRVNREDEALIGKYTEHAYESQNRQMQHLYENASKLAKKCGESERVKEIKTTDLNEAQSALLARLRFKEKAYQTIDKLEAIRDDEDREELTGEQLACENAIQILHKLVNPPKRPEESSLNSLEADLIIPKEVLASDYHSPDIPSDIKVLLEDVQKLLKQR